MVKRVPTEKKQMYDSEWFNEECKQCKGNAKFLQSVYAKTKTVEDRLAYVAAWKAYKTLIKNKMVQPYRYSSESNPIVVSV